MNHAATIVSFLFSLFVSVGSNYLQVYLGKTRPFKLGLFFFLKTDLYSFYFVWYGSIFAITFCFVEHWFWDNQICKDWTDYLRVVFFPQKRNVVMSCFVTVLSQWMSNKHGNCEGYTSYRDYILCLFIHSLHLFRLICFKTFSFVKKHQSLSAFLLTCKSRINTASKTWTKTDKC